MYAYMYIGVYIYIYVLFELPSVSLCNFVETTDQFHPTLQLHWNFIIIMIKDAFMFVYYKTNSIKHTSRIYKAYYSNKHYTCMDIIEMIQQLQCDGAKIQPHLNV